MKKELDNYLVKRYPSIFRDRHGDKNTTAMSWGFCCGDGWFKLLDSTCGMIENHIQNIIRENEFNQKWIDRIKNGDENVPPWIQEKMKNGALEREIKEVPEVVATQIKEKFGTLRFYYSGGDEYINGLISMAEAMSAHICEDCGANGSLRNAGWVRTLCDKHAKLHKCRELESNAVEIGQEFSVLVEGGYKQVVVDWVISTEEFRGKLIPPTIWDEQKKMEVQIEIPDEFYHVRKVTIEKMDYYWDAERII